MDADLVREALEAAREIEEPGRRAIAMAEIWHFLPADTQSPVAADIDRAVQGVEDRWYRAITLADLICALPAAELRLATALTDTIREIEKDEDFDKAIVDIATRLPPRLALALFGSLDVEPRTRDSFSSQAARVFPPELAATIVVEISDPYMRQRAQTTVRKRLSPISALAVARTMADGRGKDEVLAELADRVGAAEALKVVELIADQHLKGEVLLRLAGRLNQDHAREAVASIFGCPHDLNHVARAFSLACHEPELRARLLARLIPRIEPPVQAFDLCHRIEDSFWRAEALVAAMRAMTSHDMQPRLMATWAELLRIFSTKTRASFIAELIDLLPLIVTSAEQRSTLLTTASGSVERVGRWWP